MRTLIIIGAGLALLLVFVALGRFSGLGLRAVLPWFVALWVIAAAVNMYIGVARAGYSFMEELPIFLLIAAVPIAAALAARRFLPQL